MVNDIIAKTSKIKDVPPFVSKLLSKLGLSGRCRMIRIQISPDILWRPVSPVSWWFHAKESTSLAWLHPFRCGILNTAELKIDLGFFRCAHMPVSTTKQKNWIFRPIEWGLSYTTIIGYGQEWIRVPKNPSILVWHHTKILYFRLFTQSTPFRKWIPINGPTGNVLLIKLIAWFFMFVFHTRYWCKFQFSAWTGKLAGAPVKANTTRIKLCETVENLDFEKGTTRWFIRRIFLIPFPGHILMMDVVIQWPVKFWLGKIYIKGIPEWSKRISFLGITARAFSTCHVTIS